MGRIPQQSGRRLRSPLRSFVSAPAPRTRRPETGRRVFRTWAWRLSSSCQRAPRIASGEVASFLAGLPSPAMLLQTTVRGTLSVVLLEELSGERAQAARREFDNQRTLLEEMIRQAGLGPESRILLELDTKPHILSLDAMRIWAERFVVIVGWAITRLDGAPRADARMAALRSDGVGSPGWPGPGR